MKLEPAHPFLVWEGKGLSKLTALLWCPYKYRNKLENMKQPVAWCTTLKT
jgi:hypothetical protein